MRDAVVVIGTAAAVLLAAVVLALGMAVAFDARDDAPPSVTVERPSSAVGGVGMPGGRRGSSGGADAE